MLCCNEILEMSITRSPPSPLEKGSPPARTRRRACAKQTQLLPEDMRWNRWQLQSTEALLRNYNRRKLGTAEHLLLGYLKVLSRAFLLNMSFRLPPLVTCNL